MKPLYKIFIAVMFLGCLNINCGLCQLNGVQDIESYLHNHAQIDSVQGSKQVSIELSPTSFINGIVKIGAECYFDKSHSFKLTLGYGFSDSAVIYKGLNNITEIILEGEYRYYLSSVSNNEKKLSGFFIGGYGLVKKIDFQIYAVKVNPVTRVETYVKIDKTFKAEAMGVGYLMGYRKVMKSLYVEGYFGSGMMYSRGDKQYINQNVMITQLKYRNSIMPYGGLRIGFYL